MALRFMDGFDFYLTADLGQKWTTSNNATTQSTVARFSYGRALNINTGNVSKTIDSQTTWTVGFALRFGGLGTSGDLVRFKNGSNVVGILSLSSAGILSIISQNVSTTTTLATGTNALVTNVWYYVEFKYTCAATALLVVADCHVNGVSECSVAATSGGSTTNGTSVDTIVLTGPGFGVDYYYDDFYACDTSGSTNTTFLGDVRIEALRPNGAGYNTDFSHTGASTNWQAVSETTEDGDTSYVSSSTAGNIDSYTMGDMSSTPSSIFAVQAVMVARKDDAGSRTVDQLTRISSTNYLGSDVSVQDSYKFITRIMETSPATSAAWTASEVNGVEMGIKLVS